MKSIVTSNVDQATEPLLRVASGQREVADDGSVDALVMSIMAKHPGGLTERQLVKKAMAEMRRRRCEDIRELRAKPETLWLK